MSSRKWFIRFVRNRGPRALAGEAPAVEPSPELVDELTKRGVTLSTARELAGTFPEERIREKLASFDWLRGESDGRVLRSPAGSSSVHPRELRPTGRLQAPSGEGPDHGGERKKARQLEEDRERREAAEEERERLRLERVRAYWDSLAEDEKLALVEGHRRGQSVLSQAIP